MQAPTAVIVNLSASYKSREIYSYDPRVDTVASQIAQLANIYSSTSQWDRCCCGFFNPGKLVNAMWVVQLYMRNRSTVIDPYRLGNISTDQFMQRFVQAFDFLRSANYPDTVISALYNRRHEFVSFPPGHSLEQLRSDKTLVAKLLLEDAWNSLIPDFDEETKARWQYIVSLARRGQPVYLISNTNELNVRRVLTLLQKEFPDAGDLTRIDTAVKVDDNPIPIAPNLYLCPSYRMHAFKAEGEQRRFQPGTPGLLQKLLQQQLNGKRVEVISQYPKDLEIAQEAGVPAIDCHAAQYFFGLLREQQQQSKKPQ